MPFLNSIRAFFEAVGILQSILWLVGGLAVIWVIGSGVIPVIWRLGTGLARRKIAIFAKGDHLQALQDLLVDSGLFKQKNIRKVTSPKDMGVAEKATVYLVYWNDWQDDIDKVLSAKKDKTALVVYAPEGRRSVPDDQFQKISQARNTSVTNVRGRLLNDLITSMITTSYQKE